MGSLRKNINNINIDLVLNGKLSKIDMKIFIVPLFIKYYFVCFKKKEGPVPQQSPLLNMQQI